MRIWLYGFVVEPFAGINIVIEGRGAEWWASPVAPDVTPLTCQHRISHLGRCSRAVT
jgi:hypothetical protein